MLSNAAIIFGSTTCYTEMAAEKIQASLHAISGEQTTVPLFDIKEYPLSIAEQYDFIIFGISTWDFGELQEDWESQWDDIKKIDLNGKTIALFGLGDQLGYAEWFQDALGMLHDEIILQDVTMLGYWPNQGYDFIASKALTADNSHFVGLSLDDENQYDESEARIKAWCAQILQEYQ